VQAAICSRFGVAWHRYGALTLREVRVLLSVITDENADERPPSSRPGPDGRPPRTPRPGERLERVV